MILAILINSVIIKAYKQRKRNKMNNNLIKELAEKSELAEATDVRNRYIYLPAMYKFTELIIGEFLDI